MAPIAPVLLVRDHGADHADRERGKCGTVAMPPVVHVDDVARGRVVHGEWLAASGAAAPNQLQLRCLT